MWAWARFAFADACLARLAQTGMFENSVRLSKKRLNSTARTGDPRPRPPSGSDCANRLQSVA